MTFNRATCRRKQISQIYGFVQRFQCHAVMREKKIIWTRFFLFRFCFFCLFLLPLKTVLAEALTHT